MKPKPTLRSFLPAALASLALVSGTTQAALTWDANDVTAGQTDGGGAWLTANKWWDGSTNVNWTTGSDAIFGNGGAGGTVSLAGTTTIQILMMNSFTGTYTLGTTGATNTITINNGITVNSGAGATTFASPVTLANSQTISNSSANALTMATVNSSSKTITKTGGGQLVLTANNSTTVTGSVWDVQGGTLSWGNASGLGAATTTINLNGGNLDAASNQGGQTAQNNIHNWNADFTWVGSASSFSIGAGAVTLSANRQVTVSANLLTVGGVIGDGGNGYSLTKAGAGALVLAGSNTYTGTTSVTGGLLRLGNANALKGGIGLTGGLSGLTLNGGVVELASSDLLRNLGSGSDQFQITGGTSGFSAFAGPRNVIVNNDPNLEVQWGSANFAPATLVLNETTATDQLFFQNKLDLNGADRTINVNTNTATISGNIRTTSGTAGLTKGGAGTLVLTGTNTYNGVTTVSGGILSVPATASLPGYATPGKVVFNGGTVACTIGGGGWTTANVDSLLGAAIINSGSALGIDTSNCDLTQWTAFSGSLGLNKLGTNTLTLNQVNAYTGPTTLSGGTLKIQNPGSGLTQTLNGGGLTIAGPDVTLLSDYNSGTGTLSTTFGALSRNAGSTVNISVVGGTPGTDNLVNLTGSAGFVNAGAFYNGSDFAWLASSNGYVRAPIYGTDANTINNPSSPIVSFSSTTHYRLTGSITQTNSGNAATLKIDTGSGGTLSQGSGYFGANAILKTGGGSPYTFSGTVRPFNAVSGGNLIIRTDASGDQVILNGFDIAANLTKSGAGTVTFNNSASSLNNIYVNGGTLEFGGAGSISSAIYPIVINSGAIFLYNSTTAKTISGSISGGGNLTKNNTSTLTLSAPNSYTGTTTVSGGQITIQNAAALGSTSGNTVIASGAQVFAGTAGLSVAEPFNIAGNGTAAANGALQVGGSATVTFTGPITLSGNATVKADGGATAICKGGFTLGANTLGLSAGGSGFVTVNTTGISGTGGVAVNPTGLTGAVNLLVANTFTGPVSVGNGTLGISSIDVVANPNPLGQSSTAPSNLLLGNSSTLKYTGSGGTCDRGFTINGTAAGNQATLDSSGTGPLNLTNTASPAYGTVDQSRVLILAGTNTGNNTLEANIANNGTAFVNVQKNGAGTWVLTGVNTTTGSTTINAGKLVLGAAGALPSGAVNLGAATLDAQTFANSGGALDVTGAGVINLGGGGTLVFADSSAKTWTGGTLNITGTFTNTSVKFGSSNTALTPAQLAVISVNGSGLGTYTLDANGYLVAPGGGSNYSTWATTNGITGQPFAGDYDNDGVSNGLEYALGKSPTASSQPPGVFSGNTITFTKGTDAINNGDVSWVIETSETLATGSWTPVVTQSAGDTTPTISYAFTPGTPAKKFARLKVVQVP